MAVLRAFPGSPNRIEYILTASSSRPAPTQRKWLTKVLQLVSDRNLRSRALLPDSGVALFYQPYLHHDSVRKSYYK